MSEEKKRKLDVNDEPKRSKIELNLRLNDEKFTEKDYQSAFQTIANQLINSHELVVHEENLFRLNEIEFYFYQQIRHPDTFAHRHPEQTQPSKWYFHRQGTTATASYKAGTYKGLDITFSSSKDESYGGILIRSIENKQTGQIYEGSCLVVDALLNLCTIETIKELVEIKLTKNLDIFNKNSYLYLRSIATQNNQDLIASPRVGLTLKIPSIERERFLFRPYRFTSKTYFPSKMKMTILLSLAAEKYFQNSKKIFLQYADDLARETKTRLALIKTYLIDLQNGFEFDTSKKTSPLIDFYKKTMSTSDLAKAYGIWLQKYREN